MNIEKINKLYENMLSLQELFDEEPNPVEAINGLRFASAEFRGAFFKVRETLLKSPVSKQAQEQVRAKEKEKEKENNTPKPKKTTKKATTTTIPKKEKDPLKDKFDEFILDSYNESSRDELPVSTSIDEIIRMFSLYANFKLNNQIYSKFRKYLRNIYTADGDKIYLKPKSIDLPNESKLDASTMLFYQHPKFKYLWCREDGSFFYLLPDGKTIKENPIIKSPKAVYLSVVGGKSNHSARLTALECYMHRVINGYHVSVLNGNKNDLSYANLSISTMPRYKGPNNKYDESDAVLVCEYIVAHGKDIRNIESDTDYKIGYAFAKSVLEKRRFEKIANKYF